MGETVNVNQTGRIEHSLFSIRKALVGASKKAFFFISLPFYWLVFFNYILNFFDSRLFIFVVGASVFMSLIGQNWGVLNALLK